MFYVKKVILITGSVFQENCSFFKKKIKNVASRYLFIMQNNTFFLENGAVRAAHEKAK